MGLFEHFPYSNFHQLNIDWVLEKVKYCLAQVEAFATRLENAEDDIADLQSAVSNLQTALEALRTNLQNQINTLGSRVTVNENNIATLQADLENAERNIISLVGDLAQLGETVDLMGVHLANVDTAIDGLTTRVTTAESSITQLLTDVASLDGRMDTAEGSITQLQDQMAGTESSGLLDQIQSNALPPYSSLDWDSSLRIIDIGGGVYRPAWHAPAVVSFATGNISAANLTSPTVTALRTGNTVQIDLEGEVTATDDVVITVSKYRPIGSAGSALPWQIPAIVNEITHATTTYEIDNSGDLIITVFNLTAADAFGLHLVYITDEPIEQPA